LNDSRAPVQFSTAGLSTPNEAGALCEHASASAVWTGALKKAFPAWTQLRIKS